MIQIYDGNNYIRRRIEAGDPRIARSLLSRVQAMTNDVHIFVWDGKGCNERRRALYPQYKTKREQPGEDIFQYMTLVQQVLCYTDALQFQVDGYEADDVIATLVQNKWRKNSPAFIHSNDSDLLQLKIDGVSLDRESMKDVDDEDVHLYKTLVGDTADNIKGIPGFGKTTWAKLSRTEKQNLQKHIVDGCSYEISISPRVDKWIQENNEKIKTLWTVTGFFDVPAEQLEAGFYQGINNPELADALLKEYLQ